MRAIYAALLITVYLGLMLFIWHDYRKPPDEMLYLYCHHWQCFKAPNDSQMTIDIFRLFDGDNISISNTCDGEYYARQRAGR